MSWLPTAGRDRLYGIRTIYSRNNSAEIARPSTVLQHVVAMAFSDDRSADDPWYWRREGWAYHSLSVHWRRLFGQKAAKAPIDAGCDCPNRDGTLGRDGCIFCNPASFSVARREGAASIEQQIARARAAAMRTSRWTGGAGSAIDRRPLLVAYFQPGTNTYGATDRLLSLYREALRQEGVAGLIIGTRPDCISDDLLSELASLARHTWLMLELGVQTLCDRSLQWMNRGHDSRATIDAVSRARALGLRVGAHLILGLPGEDIAQMRDSACRLAALGVESLKLHHLYAVRGTRLARSVERGEVRLPTEEEHSAALIDVLEHLPPHVVIDRLMGDTPSEYLIGPAWSLRKTQFLNRLRQTMLETGSYQGRRWAGEFEKSGPVDQ